MIDFTGFFISVDMRELRKFNDFSEGNLQKYQDEIGIIIDNATNGMTEEERVEYTSLNDHIWWSSDISYPNLMRKSNFLSYFSYLEHQMNVLCKAMQKKHGYDISLEDLRGSGIVRARQYIMKVCLIKDAFNEYDWKRLRNYQGIRNSITHAYGDAQREEYLSVKDIEGVNGIDRINEFSEESIEYTVDFNYSFIELIERILNRLVTKCRAS